MELQHKVILSLGSNQGNRLAIIELCLDMIHREIGSIIKISDLYESPSWGFEADPFYNCALLMHSMHPAERILEMILQLETKLGRIRGEQSGYQSRLIDVDLISYDEEIVDLEQLRLPHPELQNRNFVLLPMRDLKLDWVHPVLKKNVAELLLSSPDQSDCRRVCKLESPLDNIQLNRYNYIAIEGNIGAGKSTLALKMAEDFNAKTVLERFADNPFLPKFYEDHSRYAFSLEMSFLADRYQQLSDDLAQFDLFKDFVIADYHIFKSLLFSKITLEADEFRLYRTLFDIIYKETPKPDLYIYLYQNTERLLQNIKSRGRVYEQDISTDYLERINQGYLEYIKTQTDLNILILDVSDRDFVKNQQDYLYIIEKIQEKIRS